MVHLVRVFLIAGLGTTFLNGCCLLKYWPMPWGGLEAQEQKETVPVRALPLSTSSHVQKITF